MVSIGFKQVTVIVMDGVGIGTMLKHPPRDKGANTIRNVAIHYNRQHAGKFRLPNFARLGLGNIDPRIPGVPPAEHPAAAFGRFTLDPLVMTETIPSHWAMMGLNSGAYALHESGLPRTLMAFVEKEISKRMDIEVHFLKDGRNISGTTIIEGYPNPSLPIAYTSRDSVFQIAYHVGRETSISQKKLNEMYAICQACRDLFDQTQDDAYKFLRVIARPYVTRRRLGLEGEKFIRLGPRRRDYTSPMPGNTILDLAQQAGLETISIGKVHEMFSGQGIGTAFPPLSEKRHLRSDMEGIDFIISTLQKKSSGIIFANLVDCDEKFGHRNNPIGFAENLMAIDRKIPEIIAAMTDEDIVIFTGDHGNDPTRGLGQGLGTNHTREFTPFLAFGNPIASGANIGIKPFADLAATIVQYLNLKNPPHGTSFWNLVKN